MCGGELVRKMVPSSSKALLMAELYRKHHESLYKRPGRGTAKILFGSIMQHM